LAAIPTTSGSGSDATWAAIITDKIEKRKITLVSREIIPSLSVIDPLLPAEMPKQLTVSTGLDALTHAVEAFISTWHNDFSDAFSIRALQLIFNYLPRAVSEGSNDMLAREKLHNAATMAGIAISNSQVSIAHSMGHALGAIFDVSHGLAVSIALPYCLEFSLEDAKERLEELAISLGYETSEMFIEGIRGLMQTIDAPLSYTDVVKPKNDFLEQLTRLVELANGESATVVNPRIPTEEEFERLFLYTYEGKKVDF
jgi:alcohol dehydrogenase class IV